MLNPLSVPLALLPRPWRRRWMGEGDVDLRRGAVLAGVGQVVLALAALAFGYPAFVRGQMEGLSDVMLAAAEKGGETAVMGMGPMWLVAYLFQPLSLLLLFLMAEGMVRWMAVVIHGEVVPSVFLVILAWAHQRLALHRAEKALGPRVPDRVERLSEGELLVSSCRPKPNWNRMVTVSYQDELYEVMGAEVGRPPRMFVYGLRKSPQGRIIRGIHTYDPQEVMTEE